MSQFSHGIFSTPLLIGKSDNPTICAKICELALQFKENAVEAALVSEGWNYGKVSSAQDDFDKYGVTSFKSGSLLDNPDWAEVLDFIQDFAATMIGSVNNTNSRVKFLNSWVTIYPPGTYVPEHVHSNSMLSGVFYAKVPEGAGDLLFKDPSAVAKTMYIHDYNTFPTVTTTHTHKVEENQMIIFPSWLPHLTSVNRATENRIMVSFNIDMKDAT